MPEPTAAEVLTELVKLVVVIGLLIGVYEGLHRWHPPVAATYSGDAAASLRSLVVRGGSRPVTWNVPGVYATTVDLSGPADEDGTLALPVRPSACTVLASSLGLSCSGGRLVAPEGVELQWSAPQLLYLATADRPSGRSAGSLSSDAVSLDVSSSGGSRSAAPATTGPASATTGAAPPGRPSVQLTVSGAGPLDWCYATPSAGAALTMRSGGRSVTLPGADITTSGCPGGLPVTVPGSAEFSGHRPPAVTFGRVTSLSFQATSFDVEAEDLGGMLHLGEAGTNSLSPAAVVHLATHGQSAVQTALSFAGTTEELNLASPRLSDASADGIQLVDSWWDRENSISIPLFLAVCAAPLPLLPSLLETLWRWRRAPRPAPGRRESDP